ncbi:hypothetical protein KCU71_g21116, partial [Aureobasidium melanogenum]
MARFAQGPPAHLWIAALLSLTYSCFTWFLRIYARVGYYGIDDVAITVAHEHTCPNDMYRWRAILAIAICIEAAVMGLPIYLVSHLRIKASKKMLVVSAFAYRMPMIAFALLYLKAYSEAVRSEERVHHFTKVIIWQQALICYSLLSATLPFVQAFMRSFTTGGTAFGSIIYGSRNSRSNSSGDTSRSRSRNESFTPQFLGRTKTVCRGAGKQVNNEAHR